MAAIRLENLSKRYLIHHKRQLVAQRVWKRRQNVTEPFWALRDVSFAVKGGETVGIVGHNGAGKSTLLEIVAGTSSPTTGRVERSGKIAAMLEVGTGFHADLTGAENIHLNAALLGMSKTELQRKFDSIVEFSGIADFIDEPARTYSTGMLSRLGFAVAVHFEPEILILDEVLSVGDRAFLRQCAKEIDRLVNAGSLALVASHNLDVVAALCSRVIWLDHGRVKSDGPAGEILLGYADGGALRNPRVLQPIKEAVFGADE